MAEEGKRIKFRIVFLVILFLTIDTCWAKANGGLIFSGIDTIYGGQGFDFVLQRPCSTSGDAACNPHFDYLWDGGYNGYIGRLSGLGLMLDLGKLNLDSIKSAPPDSVMKDDYGLGQLYVFFKIAPD